MLQGYSAQLTKVLRWDEEIADENNRKLLEQAEAILKNNWTAVKSLAFVLYRQRALGGREARRIIKDTIDTQEHSDGGTPG